MFVFSFAGERCISFVLGGNDSKPRGTAVVAILFTNHTTPHETKRAKLATQDSTTKNSSQPLTTHAAGDTSNTPRAAPHP